METWNPEMVTAAGGVLIGILVVFFGKGRKVDTGETKPSPHQEVVRPETASEIKSAHALASIAETLKKMERNIDLMLDRQRAK